MAKRKIIEIDRDMCNGCGLCTTACAEGALALDAEKKAVLVHEIYCDGLGACLDVCPTGALKVIERESDDYDARATVDHVRKTRGAEAASRVHGAGGAPARAGHSACPGSLARNIPREPEAAASPAAAVRSRAQPMAHPAPPRIAPRPVFRRTATSSSPRTAPPSPSAVSMANCSRGRSSIIACPKLDDTEGYVEKLAELVKRNNLRSLTVAIMTVPCCSGLERIVRLAVERSGVPLEVKKVVVGIDGKIVPGA